MADRKPENLVKEFTTGNCGGWWMRYGYIVSLSDEGFRMKGLLGGEDFVPRADIVRLVSESLPKSYLSGRGNLRVVHKNSASTSELRFLSTRPESWFSAFEALGIPAEDSIGLRGADTSFPSVVKGMNVGAAVLGGIAAAIAVVLAIIAMFKA